MNTRRVVVTGIGIWSCLGRDVTEVTESLRNGRSGIGLDTDRMDYGYQSGLTGVVARPDLKGFLSRRMRAGMSEAGEYAYMAAREAFGMAGIDDGYREANEIGILFGNDTSAKGIVEAHETMVRTKDSELIGAGNVFQAMNSTVTMNLSIAFQLRGISMTVSAACASGSHSIGMGYMMIKQGMQDMILCGGAQEVNKYAMSSFDALGAFSKRMDDPSKACRPFDKERDGLVPSGGAAALVLEDYDHAVARGATILAEVRGYGFSSNGGGGLSRPSDEGSYLAMVRALSDAGIGADEVDYVNAHATGTPQGDEIEARAINRIFEGRKAWVSSTKSMTGHECWMAGASEAVYSILMMRNGFVAPNINLTTPDEEAARMRIATETVETEVRTVLSNSFGFGGTNSAIVFGQVADR